MKRMTLILLAALASTTALAQAEKKAAPRDFSVPDNLRDAKTLNLCVDYYSQKNADKKAAELKELKRRGMLSVKDDDLLKGKQKTLENGNTRCAMYMTRGIPLHEKGKFIGHTWVRTPKIVHVYDDKYYVSQSGIITRVYDRVPGQLPPQLDAQKPKVAPPPVIMHANPAAPAPVDRPHQQTMEK
ncbi:hypothetical protein SAMN05443662_0819 [Sulfurivirga caldicuralii]|uniref:Uncharacterized protein n=1 Tax=Sulfurivirga caldicuralii TaxID=364032 RepID=A0A1N6EXQ0_9GAMM|nr:hypothetical protein [Sulfurivirga caldicuralii]SIN87756.1 hypothetical protein SAMN05443662_0819 [Sulfurivirga caldicuralii]